MPQFDTSTFASQLFWLGVTFFLLYILMSRLALPRVQEVMEKRRHRIAQDLSKADAFSDQAEAARMEYERNYADSKEKAALIISETSISMRNSIEEKRKELDREYQDKVEQAVQTIAAKRGVIQGQLEQVAQDVTQTIITKLVGAKADDAAIAAALKKK